MKSSLVKQFALRAMLPLMVMFIAANAYAQTDGTQNQSGEPTTIQTDTIPPHGNPVLLKGM